MTENTDAGSCGAFGTDYAKADMLGADKIHMEMVPDFSGKGERAIFTDSWSYVLNKASKNKDAAVKFLQYMADEGGMGSFL